MYSADVPYKKNVLIQVKATGKNTENAFVFSFTKKKMYNLQQRKSLKNVLFCRVVQIE